MSDVDPDDAVTFRYRIGPEEPPSYALVIVLSALTEVPPDELGPVGDTVDLEALDSMFSAGAEETVFSSRLLLSIDGCHVAVDDTEIVGVARREGEPSESWQG